MRLTGKEKTKELEALECIVVDLTPLAKKHNMEDIKTIEKSLEALEIIKKKGLSINDIAFIKNGETHEKYIETMKELYWGDEHLDKVLKTKEEYDLLKEVLEK